MWRYTSLPVRVGFLDARACLPLLVYVVYWSWATAYIAITGVVFFSVISWFGLTLPAVYRVVRRWLVGRVRPAVPA
jgi:intracellular multiplication protein IcmT